MDTFYNRLEFWDIIDKVAPEMKTLFRFILFILTPGPCLKPDQLNLKPTL